MNTLISIDHASISKIDKERFDFINALVAALSDPVKSGDAWKQLEAFGVHRAGATGKAK